MNNSWIMIVVMATFFFMVLLPFLIAVKELRRPTDNAPLHIAMAHSKDPFYFGTAFKEIMHSKAKADQVPIGTSEVQLSKKEWLGIFASKRLPPGSRVDQILYIKGDLETGEKANLLKEIYVEGNAVIGAGSEFRAMFSEHDITIGENCKVDRWVCAEGDIKTDYGCRFGRSLACKGKLEIHNANRFQTAFGNPIVTPDSNPEATTYPDKETSPKEVDWEIIKNEISINVPPPKDHETADESYIPGDPDTTPPAASETEPPKEIIDKEWKVSRKQVVVPTGAVVHTNFVTRKKLVIEKNCTIHGSLKGYEGVEVDENTVIHGDIFAEGDVKLNKNCTVLGHIFCQGRIDIENGCRISKPGMIKSVIGKKRIQLRDNVVIYGYLLTEGVGTVKK